MNDIFLKIVNMSITGSFIAFAVIVIRCLFKRVPKWIICSAWGLVALRLILPFSFESYFSLVPNAAQLQVAAPAAVPQTSGNTVAAVGTQAVDVTGILSKIWLAGAVAMILYSVAVYVRIRIKTRVSLKEDGVYICDAIPTPFLLGVIKPRIYVPSSVNKEELDCIVLHENAHKRRGDHLWKPLGFLLLSIYWFNPLMWVAYVMLCRDIEYACDEKVINTLGTDIRARYSEALLRCSVSKRTLAACPVAFAEAGVKERIKRVLSYKKPTVWIIAACLLITTVSCVFFMTDPKRPEEPEGAPAVLDAKENSGENDEVKKIDPCAAGHDYVLISAAEPSCKEEGKTVYVCSVCGDNYTKTAERLAHEYTGVLTSEANCISGAITTYTCSVCGDSYTETGDVAADAHDYSVYEVLTYPGCLSGGVNKISCSRCGAYYTVDTAATGHNYVLSTSTAATCLTDGYSTYTCSGCGDSYTETFAATGHNFAGATCSAPETCVLCGLTRGEPVAHRPGKCEFCGAIIKYNVEEPEIPSISIYD